MASGASKRPLPLRALHRGSPAGVRSPFPPDGRTITSWSVEPQPPDGTDESVFPLSPVAPPPPSAATTAAAAGPLTHPCFADGVYTAPTSGLYALTLAIIPVGSACLAAGLGAPRSAVDVYVRVVAADGADVAAHDVGPISWGEVLHLPAGSRVSVVRRGGRGDALRLCIELLQRKRRPPGQKGGADGDEVKRPRVAGGNAPAQEGSGAFRGVATAPPALAPAAAEVALAAAAPTAVAPATAARAGGRERRPKRPRQRGRATASAASAATAAASATTAATTVATTVATTAAVAASPRAPSPSLAASPPAATVAAVDNEDGPPDVDEEGDDDSWDAAFESSPSGEDEALSVRGVNALARELRTRV